MVNLYKKIVLVSGLEQMSDYHFRVIKSLLNHDLKLTKKMQDDYDRIKIADLMEEMFPEDAGLSKLIEVCEDIPELRDCVDTLRKKMEEVKSETKINSESSTLPLTSDVTGVCEVEPAPMASSSEESKDTIPESLDTMTIQSLEEEPNFPELSAASACPARHELLTPREFPTTASSRLQTLLEISSTTLAISRSSSAPRSTCDRASQVPPATASSSIQTLQTCLVTPTLSCSHQATLESPKTEPSSVMAFQMTQATTTSGHNRPRVPAASVSSSFSKPQVTPATLPSSIQAPQMPQATLPSSVQAPRMSQSTVPSSVQAPRMPQAAVPSGAQTFRMNPATMTSGHNHPRVPAAAVSSSFSKPQVTPATLPSSIQAPRMPQATLPSGAQTFRMNPATMTSDHNRPQVCAATAHSGYSNPQVTPATMTSGRNHPQVCAAMVHSSYSNPWVTPATVARCGQALRMTPTTMANGCNTSQVSAATGSNSYDTPQITQTTVPSSVQSLWIPRTALPSSAQIFRMTPAAMTSGCNSPQVSGARVPVHYNNPRVTSATVPSGAQIFRMSPAAMTSGCNSPQVSGAGVPVHYNNPRVTSATVPSGAQIFRMSPAAMTSGCNSPQISGARVPVHYNNPRVTSATVPGSAQIFRMSPATMTSGCNSPQVSGARVPVHYNNTATVPSGTQTFRMTPAAMASGCNSPQVTAATESSSHNSTPQVSSATVPRSFPAMSVSPATPLKKPRLKNIPKQPSEEDGHQEGSKQVKVLKATEPFTYDMRKDKRMFHATVATETEFFRVKVFVEALKEKFIPQKVIVISDYIGSNGFLEIYRASCVSEANSDNVMSIPSSLRQRANATPKISTLCTQRAGTFVNGTFTVYVKRVKSEFIYYGIEDSTGRMEVVVYGQFANIHCEPGDKLRLFCFELSSSLDTWQLRSVRHSFMQVIQSSKRDSELPNPHAIIDTDQNSHSHIPEQQW
ncbi:mucin-5AC-like [Mastomys coucha]|uniref:mucin-5AC-like n=1 Tax=Mastomys coucha TaxID=35658 RepID=UPI00126233A0|nr:mucin-5AC-like [Mastomys coucha]XP_031246116.1 mucin-5AC-like [Mastomys coucha]